MTLNPPSRTGLAGVARLVREPALLVLEDGRVFRGLSYGSVGETLGEAVFSTGMTGYQETLTDPSYHRQVTTATAPARATPGSTTRTASRTDLGGRVRRARPGTPLVQLAGDAELEDELRDQGVVGICRVDTRALTRHLRERGSMRVGIFSGSAVQRPGVRARRGARGSVMAGSALSRGGDDQPAVRRPGQGREAIHGGALDLGIKEMTSS